MAEEWITGKDAAELLGMPQNNFLYYVKNGEIAIRPGSKERMREYSREDTLKVGRRLARKKKPVQEKPLIDWLYAADVPAGLKLSMQVYPGEVDLAEAAIYQAWRKNNPYLTMAAFSPDRAECYASVQVVPLASEQIILDVLSNRREEASITPDEIPGYDQPGAYNLLVTSATCLPDRPQLLYQVLYRYVQFWLSQYPERHIKRVYAQAVSESGMRIVQHFFMSPLLTIAPNAFMLDLAYPPASKMIRHFKEQLEEKAPLPDDLRWPPIEAPQPLYRFTVDREIAEQATLPTMPAPQRPPRQKAATTSLDALQPEGTITVQELAELLNMSRRSLLDHILRRDLAHIAIPHPSRAGEMKRYFTPEQVEQVRQVLGK